MAYIETVKYVEPKKPEGISNEQMLLDVKDAQHSFVEKLAVLLRWGSYNIKNLHRDIRTNAVNTATLELEPGVEIYLRSFCDYVDNCMEVCVGFSENPVNQELLEHYDRMSIDRDIDYHRRQLESLTERREELAKKQKVTGA